MLSHFGRATRHRAHGPLRLNIVGRPKLMPKSKERIRDADRAGIARGRCGARRNRRGALLRRQSEDRRWEQRQRRRRCRGLWWRALFVLGALEQEGLNHGLNHGAGLIIVVVGAIASGGVSAVLLLLAHCAKAAVVVMHVLAAKRVRHGRTGVAVDRGIVECEEKRSLADLASSVAVPSREHAQR